MTFIQVGSNVGVMEIDPLCDLIRKNSWTGVLIEPVPYLFKKLQENYSYREGLYFENIAISEKCGEKSFYYITKEDIEKNMTLPSWASAIGSFDPLFVRKHGLRIKPIEIKVPCNTLKYIRDKYRLYELDLLHVDAEGYDINILNSIDFDDIHPKVIIFECSHSDGVKRTGNRYISCCSRLEKFGYTFVLKDGNDVVFIDKDHFPIE